MGARALFIIFIFYSLFILLLACEPNFFWVCGLVSKSELYRHSEECRILVGGCANIPNIS